jgi:hypothetical protein
MLRLIVTANVPKSPILVTLMIEAISSAETSVLTRATRHNILEDGIPCYVLLHIKNPSIAKGVSHSSYVLCKI